MGRLRGHRHDGDKDTAGKFHYQEWECKRKLAEQNRHRGEAAKLELFWVLGGYGEHPGRVIGAGAVVILLLGMLYLKWGFIPPDSHWCLLFAGCWESFGTYVWKSLYFSVLSFAALSFGRFAPSPDSWVRHLGVVESLVGIPLISLFLVTFTRKMTR